MKKILAIIAIVLSGYFVFAHEYILLAYKYKVQKGDSLELHLFVSDGFNIQMERSLQKKMIKDFKMITENGTTDLLAQVKEESLPVLLRQVDFNGLGLIYMERNYARITLDNEKFLSYLKEDHIENIHIDAVGTKTSQRERYTRYIKTLVQSGANATGGQYKLVTGQRFEIVLQQNPYLLKKGDVMTAQILFMGKPLTNKLITARNRTGNEVAQVANSRTDKNGICSFKIKRTGEWFIHATQMIPCPDLSDSDWESFWTSYSFQIGN